MVYFPISKPVLASCLCFYICFTQARLHHHHHHDTKHKHDYSPSLSTSPSPSPSPSFFKTSYSPSPSFSPSYSPSPSFSPTHLPSLSPPRSFSPSPSPSFSPSPSPSQSNIPYICDGDRIFDVIEFGAIGDGVSDDTNAFKKTWDAACQCQSASPILLVPHRYSFVIQPTIFTGPCQSPLILQVEGTLMPPDGPESWPTNNSRRQWLVFYRINEMTFQGTGLIDGRGQKWWNLPCKPHKGPNGSTLPGPCDSPMAIRFFMSTNLTLQGLRIKDSPQFNLRFDNCKNVHVESVSITAPASSPNTDGIHIANTVNVHIYNSIISNGDDCVSIGSGCYDVDIKNISCGQGHGISIGSLGNHNSGAWVSNITIRDSTIKQSKNGVRIKTWQGGYGAVNGIKYKNILMENVRNPIIIDQFYCITKQCLNQTSALTVSDIEYTNIKGTYDVRSPPMHFGCSDSVPCRNITLSEVELLPAEGEMVSDAFCWNVYGDIQTMIIPPVSCILENTP